MKIILASRSPRRRELLARLYPSFEVVVRDADETLPDGVHPREGVQILAERKGAAVVGEVDADCIVISSDTLVEADGIPLGKPHDRCDAIRMLKLLSGRAHNVHTGVAVHYRGRVFSGVASTAVYFRKLSDYEISEYVDGGEPMDKAGSYGIQGEGGKFVEKYEGDFDTVVGLSLALTESLIKEATKND